MAAEYSGILQLVVSGFVPLLSTGILAYFLVPRSRQKDQDDLIRNELWAKVQALEIKYEKLFMQYSELNAEYSVLKAEANISAKLDELITTIKNHP